MSSTSLTSTHHNLISAANAAFAAVRPHSTTPRTTDHTCASAALTSDGRIFTGVNMFHYSTSLCAENAVLAKAAEAGVASALNPGSVLDSEEVEEGGESEKQPARLVMIVAVLSEGRGVVSPCGRCRQILADYHPWIEVLVMDSEAREVKVVGVKELLPYAWVPRGW